jgi:hypothetical protein
MLHIIIELWPAGDSSKARPLGEIKIANVGGTREVGNYRVELMKSPEYASKPGIWRKGFIKGFRRLDLGPYDLLYQALKALVGARSDGTITNARDTMEPPKRIEQGPATASVTCLKLPPQEG